MYEQHFGLKKHPFSAQTTGTDVFIGPQTAKTMAGFRRALASQDAVVTVSGQAGTGKTTLVHRSIDAIGTKYKTVRVGRVKMDSNDVLEALLVVLGVQDRPTGTIQRFAALRKKLKELEEREVRVFIVVEDALRAGTETLAELEALTAADAGESRGASIVLMGDERLPEFMKDPQLAQMQQRVRQRHTILPLCAAEFRGYLMHSFRQAGADFERIFDTRSAAFLHQLSEGIPRVANNLVESALTAGAVQGLEKISATLIATIASEEYGLSAGDFDFSAAEPPVPVTEDLAAPQPEPVVEVVPEPEPEPAVDIVPDPEPTPEPVLNVVPEPEPQPAVDVAPEPQPAVDVSPESKPDGSQEAEPVIVFADDSEEPFEGTSDIPHLIEDTLPNLAILAPRYAALEDRESEETAELVAEPEPEPESIAEVIPEPLSEPEPAAEVIPELETEPEPLAEAIPELVTEAEPEAESIPELMAEPEPVAEVIPELMTEAEPEAESIPELMAEPEPVAEVIPELVTEAEPEAESIPELMAEPEPVAEVIPELVTEAEPEAESIPELVSEPERAADVIPELATEPELAADVIPELVSESKSESVAELALEPGVVPEPVTEDSADDAVAEWDRDPTLAELKPDLEALEQAMAFAHGSSAEKTGDAQAKPEKLSDTVGEKEEIPEIILDKVIETGIENMQLEEPGDILSPQLAKKFDAELGKIAADIANAKSLEDVDDKMAETLFGTEISMITAQLLTSSRVDESANDELELEPQAPAEDTPVVAQITEEISLESTKPVNNSGLDLSASQRLKTVRALNTELHPSLREPKKAADASPSADTGAGADPESIEDQINTSITQTVKALKIPEDLVDDEPPEEKKGGFFSRFRRS